VYRNITCDFTAGDSPLNAFLVHRRCVIRMCWYFRCAREILAKLEIRFR